MLAVSVNTKLHCRIGLTVQAGEDAGKIGALIDAPGVKKETSGDAGGGALGAGVKKETNPDAGGGGVKKETTICDAGAGDKKEDEEPVADEKRDEEAKEKAEEDKKGKEASDATSRAGTADDVAEVQAVEGESEKHQYSAEELEKRFRHEVCAGHVLPVNAGSVDELHSSAFMEEHIDAIGRGAATEASLKLAEAKWEEQVSAVKMMIASMARSKNDLLTAITGRARDSEREKVKEEVQKEKKEEKERAQRVKALKMEQQSHKPLCKRPPQSWNVFTLDEVKKCAMAPLGNLSSLGDAIFGLAPEASHDGRGGRGRGCGSGDGSGGGGDGAPKGPRQAKMPPSF